MSESLGPLERVDGRWVLGDARRPGRAWVEFRTDGLHAVARDSRVEVVPWSRVMLGFRITLGGRYPNRELYTQMGVLGGLPGPFKGRGGGCLHMTVRHPYEDQQLFFDRHPRWYRTKDTSVGALLSSVPAADRPRLAEAMRTVREILSEGRAPRREDVMLRDPAPGDLGWIVQRNAALYASEFGFNTDYEGLVARIVADFAEDHDPHLERVWIAELDGRAVGCVMCVRDEAPGTARLRLLLVEPEARGLGIGDRLVGAVVDFARGAGYRELVLWTNDVLAAARRVYQRHGFVLAAEKPHRSFGQDLNGQDWRLDLHGTQE